MRPLKQTTIRTIMQTFLTLLALLSDKVYAAQSNNLAPETETTIKKELSLPFDTTPLGRRIHSEKGERVPTDIEQDFRQQDMQQFRDDYRVYNSSNGKDPLPPNIPPIKKSF